MLYYLALAPIVLAVIFLGIGAVWWMSEILSGNKTAIAIAEGVLVSLYAIWLLWGIYYLTNLPA